MPAMLLCTDLEL